MISDRLQSGGLQLTSATESNMLVEKVILQNQKNRCSSSLEHFLDPFCFLILTNDLSKCIKHSKTCHIADDSNVLLSIASPIDLATKRNHDLKKLCQ